MPRSLVDAAEAAVVAHYALQLAGRLEERHLVDRTRTLCDDARRAVRLLLSEGAPAASRQGAVPLAHRPAADAPEARAPARALRSRVRESPSPV